MLAERAPLGDLLRAHTRLAHADIDQHPLLRPLVSATVTEQQYAQALAALHPLYATLEPVLGSVLWVNSVSFDCYPRCAQLESDLRILGTMPSPDRGGLSQLMAVAAEEKLGVLYVLEGSALGGAMILSRLQKNLPTVPMAFFTGDGEGFPMRWRLFQQFLLQVADDVDSARVLAAAERCFVALRQHLDLTMAQG